MLGAKITVSHRAPFIKLIMTMSYLFHRAMIYWLSTCNHSYKWSLFLYIVILAQSICVA
jgi:hypothetical protein